MPVPRSEGRSGHRLGGRFLSLTTYRRNGSPVPTTVWFASEGPCIWVWTRSDSGKVRRLRANAEITVAQSDAKGRVNGPALHGKAAVHGPVSPTADVLFGRKYGLVLKVWRLLHALIRRAGRGHDWVYLRIDLDP